ncbi:MAG: hypothetical protein P1P81_08905, partial [Desulfobulbales bacterium]|nr:hypothetical protein [Desulfobulbales bacterium]
FLLKIMTVPFYSLTDKAKHDCGILPCHEVPDMAKCHIPSSPHDTNRIPILAAKAGLITTLWHSYPDSGTLAWFLLYLHCVQTNSAG